MNQTAPFRSPSAPGVLLVEGARLPLAFIALGLTALGAGTGWPAAQPALLLQPFMHPHMVALAHLWLPGFLLSASLGAMYQLMPVVLGTPLRGGGAAAWTHLGLHAAGIVLLVSGFAAARFELGALGGAFVSAGVLLFAPAVLRTFAASSRRDAAAWSFPLAAAWLSTTVLAGVVLALNRRWPVLTLSPLSLLRAHAHVGLAGFFLTLLQGVTFQLVPMFTLGEARHPRAAVAALVTSQIGLVVLAVGLAGASGTAALAGAALLALALAGSGIAFAATFHTRRRRELEPGIRAFVFGATLLAVATVIGLALLVAPDSTWTFRGGVVYGVVVVAGGLGLGVPGMLCKIIPFLVWMRSYGPRVGREPVPAATSLASRPLERTWLGLHAIALPTLVAAILTASPVLATTGAWLLALAIAAFLANAVRVLSHVWAPRRTAVPAVFQPKSA
jgi:hypothetical protein